MNPSFVTPSAPTVASLESSLQTAERDGAGTAIVRVPARPISATQSLMVLAGFALVGAMAIAGLAAV